METLQATADQSMEPLRAPQRSNRRAIAFATVAAVAASLLVVAAVSSFGQGEQGPIEEQSTTPQIAQTAIPNGKYYLMKMIRRQVAMKQRQAREKAEHKSPLKVPILRSYKQILADKMAEKHPVGSKSKLKQLAEAKLKKAKALLEKTARMHAAGDSSKPVEMLQDDGAEPIELQQQAPPNYQYTPLQTVPQYQAAQSMPAPAYSAAPQMQMGELPMQGEVPQYEAPPQQPPMYQQQQPMAEPQQEGYPPQQTAEQAGYPPQQQQQPGYPPQQQQQGYAPQEAYPPQQPEYAPPQPGYPQPMYQQQPMMQQQPEESSQLEASHTDCVPLFYYINSDLRDHFYSANFKELEGGKLHYAFFGVMTGVYATYKSGTIPVYRYYNNFDHDHVYTSNYKKWGKGGSYRTPDGEHGYTYEGVAFYIYKYARQGLKPIYVHVNPKNGNKIFSMSPNQAGPHSDNFKLQGTIGYGGCTPSKNDGMNIGAPGGGAGAFGGGPPPETGAGGPPKQSGSPIKMPGGGPPDDNVGMMDIPKI